MKATLERNISDKFLIFSNGTREEIHITREGNGRNSLQQTCTTTTVIISVILIFISQLCDAAENLAISGTDLKDVNGVILAFWYYLFGTCFSSVTSLIFEDIFIPENNMDILFSLIHCITATGVTFFYILASQLLKPNVLGIVFAIHIPLALTTQMFLLQSVTPPVELWVLILGLAIITLSVFTMSISAVCYTKKDNENESPDWF